MNRRRLAGLSFLLLSYLALNYSGYDALIPFFYFFLLLPFLSWLFLWLSLVRGAVQVEFGILNAAGEALPSRAVSRGESIDVRLRLLARPFLPLSAFRVKIRPFFADETQTSPEVLLRFSGERVLDLNGRYRCAHRGYWTVCVETLELWDFFGLFRLKMPAPQLPEALRVAVCPLAAEIREPLLTAAENLLGQQAVKRFQGSEFEEVVGLRDYLPGDRPRQIHWGVSARTETPQVFLYDDLRSTEIALLLLPPFELKQTGGGNFFDRFMLEGRSEEVLAGEAALSGLEDCAPPQRKTLVEARGDTGEHFWALCDGQADCAAAFLRLYRGSGRLRSLFCLPAGAFDEEQWLPNLLERCGDVPEEQGPLLARQIREATVAQLQAADETAALAALARILPQSLRFCIIVTTYLSAALTERVLQLAAEGRQLLLTLVGVEEETAEGEWYEQRRRLREAGIEVYSYRVESDGQGVGGER